MNTQLALELGEMSLVKKQKQGKESFKSFEDHVFSLEGHEGVVMAAKFNKEGRILATGGMDKKILLWSLPHIDTDNARNYGELSGHKSAITSLRWADNGLLLSSSADATIGTWDTETGKRIRKLVGHSLVVNEIDQDQNLIASAGDDGNVNVWDPKTKAPINNIHSEYPLLTVAFRRQIIYASGIEPVIRAWDVRSTSSPLFEIETQHTDSITSLAVDDNNLISRSQDDTIRLYEPKVIPGTHDRPQVYDGATSGNENFTIRTIVRENTIYSGSADHTVTSWDLTSKRLLRKLTGHTGTVIDVDEHEGKLASTSVDGKVILRYTNI